MAVHVSVPPGMTIPENVLQRIVESSSDLDRTWASRTFPRVNASMRSWYYGGLEIVRCRVSSMRDRQAVLRILRQSRRVHTVFLEYTGDATVDYDMQPSMCHVESIKTVVIFSKGYPGADILEDHLPPNVETLVLRHASIGTLPNTLLYASIHFFNVLLEPGRALDIDATFKHCTNLRALDLDTSEVFTIGLDDALRKFTHIELLKVAVLGQNADGYVLRVDTCSTLRAFAFDSEHVYDTILLPPTLEVLHTMQYTPSVCRIFEFPEGCRPRIRRLSVTDAFLADMTTAWCEAWTHVEVGAISFVGDARFTNSANLPEGGGGPLTLYVFIADDIHVDNVSLLEMFSRRATHIVLMCPMIPSGVVDILHHACPRATISYVDMEDLNAFEYVWRQFTRDMTPPHMIPWMCPGQDHHPEIIGFPALHPPENVMSDDECMLHHLIGSL
jgi:hypothetical protein